MTAVPGVGCSVMFAVGRSPSQARPSQLRPDSVADAGTAIETVSGVAIWYDGSLGSWMRTVCDERRATCAAPSAGRTTWFQPKVSFWYDASPASSSAVAAVSPPTSSVHSSPVSTSASVGGIGSGSRLSSPPEWFWMAASCAPPLAPPSVSEP